MKSVIPVLVVSMSSLAIAFAPQEQDWTPAGSRNGVTLTYRDDPQLDAREVRAVAELTHPVTRIVGLVCDFTQVLDPDVREARMLSGGVDSRYEIYLRYSSRYFVVSARDVVIDVRREPNGCTWREVAGKMPAQSGAVRMALLRGSWIVDAIDPSRSRVTYQIAVRPGGRIPGWMVRRGAVGALPDIIARVSRCLAAAPAVGGRCQLGAH
jgi:hypothetical protein